MKVYLRPLWVFICGQALLLVVFLFMPAIGTASTTLASNTSAIASTFWGWTWVVSTTRLWVYVVLEGLVLWATVKTFLATKDQA